MGVSLRALARLLALTVVAAAAPLSARAYGVEDMLRTEALGQIETAPGGRWLVFERLVPLEDAARFDLEAQDVVRTRLYRVDLAHPAPAVPLLAGPAVVGTVMLGFSPAGTQLAIGRLEGARWSLGVVTLATGGVRWFDVAPDWSTFRPTVAWLSEDGLVMLAQARGMAPWTLRRNAADQAALARLWQAASRGTQATVTAIGSGTEAGITEEAAPAQLVRLTVSSGRVTLLAQGAFETLRVSADRRYAALTEQGALLQGGETGAIRQSADLRQRQLRLVDLEGGRRWSPCAACDLPFDPPVWAPRGHRLLFFARSGTGGWSTGRSWIADAATGQAAPIALDGIQPEVLERRGAYDAVGLAWQGRAPLLRGRRGEAARADWFRLERGRATNVSAMIPDPAATLLAGARGAPLMLTGQGAWRLGPGAPAAVLAHVDGVAAFGDAGKGTAAGPLVVGWTRTGDTVRFDQPGKPPLSIVAADETQPVAASRASDRIVVRATTAAGVTRLILVGPTLPALTLATLNAPLAEVAPPDVVAIRHRLPGGARVTSWLYRPSARAGATKPPLIVIPYAGTVYGATPPALWNPGVGRTYTNVAALVGHGYAVLLPSMPDLAVDDHAPFAFAGQVLSAVDAVLAQGAADPARLGLWGHSYGGYTVATILAQSNRFKAAVASNGIYDLTSFQGTFAPTARRAPGYGLGILPWAGWTETGQPHLGATPWGNPARYVVHSPIYQAGHIATPLLIMAADRDFTPLQQGEQLFSALYRQGKDAQLVSYWGENHVLMNPANVRDAYHRIFAWFDRHFAAPVGDGPGR